MAMAAMAWKVHMDIASAITPLGIAHGLAATFPLAL